MEIEGRDLELGSEPAESGDPAAELAAARALAEDRYRELQYARAEIENVRKRADRVASDRLNAWRKALVGKFLPVLDNLRRATTYQNSEGLREGLDATLKEFEQLLAGEQLRPIEIVGKPFDPRLAEAIATTESPNADEGTVIEEVRRGYLLGDDVLRPALVVVAKRADATP
jgi:molecular chaperone GrpE